MNEHDPFHIQKIQQRIDSALRESPKDRQESRFSPYITEGKPDLENQLMSAASSAEQVFSTGRTLTRMASVIRKTEKRMKNMF